jgi:hypothetical protein
MGEAWTSSKSPSTLTSRVRHIRGEAVIKVALLNYDIIGATSDLCHTSLNILIYKNGAEARQKVLLLQKGAQQTRSLVSTPSRKSTAI